MRTVARRILTGLTGAGLALGLASCGPEKTEIEDSITIQSDANWLAYLDGVNDDWTVLESNNNDNEYNTYSFRVDDARGRVAIALACHAAEPTQLHEVEAFFVTTAEAWRVRTSCGNVEPEPGKIPVTGRISGIDLQAQEAAFIAFSTDPNEIFVSQTGFAEYVDEGVHDILAYKGPATVVGAATQITPERFFFARRVRLRYANDVAPLQLIDFGGGLAVDVAPLHNVTVTHDGPLAAGETEQATVSFVSSSRNRLLLGSSDGQQAVSYNGVPTHRGDTPMHNSDEGHEAAVKIYSAGELVRATYHLFKAPNDVTLQAPPVDASPAPQVLLSSGRIEAAWVPRTEIGTGSTKLYRFRVDGASADPATAAGVRLNVYLTPDWLDEQQAEYNFTLPDFSSLRGWRDAWGHDTALPMPYSFHAYLSTASALNILDFLLYEDITIGTDANGNEVPLVATEYIHRDSL